MPEQYDFDAFLVGGGQANVPLGPKLARRGWRVALAEREHMGGSCVNFGCMPSKAVHASARVAHLARNGRDYGVDVAGVEPVLADVLARARGHSETAERHITGAFEDNGVKLICAHARLAGRHGEGYRVAVGDETVTARHVVLDPGSTTALPPIDGLEAADPITSETWPARDDVGRRLLILGGGYIGVEMAQFYRRMGREVTLVQDKPQILTREDPEVAGWLQRCLEEEGVTFELGRRAERVDGNRLLLENGDPIEFDAIFAATGRDPNTSDLGLDTVDVQPGERGVIDTDEYGGVPDRPGLWVCGDARGGPAFTHSAHDDHHVLLGQLTGERDPGGSPNRAGRLVPYAVFTDPELGRIGLSEGQARAQGVDHDVVCVEMRSNDRARMIGQGHGMVKLIIDREGNEGRLFGATVLGPAAGELVHAFVMLMHLHRGLRSILDAVFIHPTLFEVVHQAVDTWHKRSDR